MLKDGLIFETVSASERVRILRREIEAEIAAGTFFFARGYGWYSKHEGRPARGCVLGAVMTVLGESPFYGGSVYSAIESTGFMTAHEAQALEDGYEDKPRPVYGNEEQFSGPPKDAAGRQFYRLGQRMRARPDSDPIYGK